MSVKSYKDLIIWQKSMDLVMEIYSLTKTFPREEIYGLSSQMRRAAVSIPSNIAEGHGRNSTKEYIKFLYIARGSICELQTQLILCQRMGYIDNNASHFIDTTNEISKMLNSLVNKLSLRDED